MLLNIATVICMAPGGGGEVRGEVAWSMGVLLIRSRTAFLAVMHGGCRGRQQDNKCLGNLSGELPYLAVVHFACKLAFLCWWQLRYCGMFSPAVQCFLLVGGCPLLCFCW